MSSAPQKVRFGVFELDLRERDLRKNGVKLKLQQKPFQILEMLLEAPNELVTRDQLTRRLWPGLHVSFERSLNTAVNTLRHTLGDSPRTPRFIETRPGLGYRFIAPVETLSSADGVPQQVLIDSVAVLPFETVGSSGTHSYAGDEIAESLISALSTYRHLRVIPRSTAFRFRGPDVDPVAAARALNARAIVSGHVEQRGNTFTVGVELIDVRTGYQLWGERFVHTKLEVSQAGMEISAAISRFFAIREDPSVPAPRARARSLEAHHDYLKGRYFYNKMTEENLRKSIAYFEAALAEDPENALAYTGLADTYEQFAWLNIMPPKEAHRRAKELVMTALRLEPNLAEAHTSLAGIKKLDEWDWAGAEIEYRKALELNPGCARTHHRYAALLSAVGRHAEAMQEIRSAQEIEPLSLVINMEVAWHLYMAGDYRGAMEQSWRTLAMEPKFAPAQNTLGLAYEQMGLYEEAIVELQNAHTCSGGHPATLAALGHAYASAGSRNQATDLLAELRQIAQDRHVSPYSMSLIYAGLGDRNRVFECLRQAHSERDVWLVWLKVEPRFESLRTDPRSQTLLRSMGLSGGRCLTPSQVANV